MDLTPPILDQCQSNLNNIMAEDGTWLVALALSTSLPDVDLQTSKYSQAHPSLVEGGLSANSPCRAAAAPRNPALARTLGFDGGR